MRLGLDGAKLDYVPRSADVLYHTALLEPQQSEAIYFVAPQVPLRGAEAGAVGFD
jgi:hypothetical protein